MRLLVAAGASALLLLAAACGGSKDAVTIGVLADCEGIFAPFYESNLAGAELPLLARGGHLTGTAPSDGVEGARIAGRSVRLVFGCAGEPSKGLTETRRLVELEGADVLVGPDYNPNGIPVVAYSHRRPETTFVLASDESEDWQSPGPNVFRFNLDLLQQTAGLGAYAYDDLGWRDAVTLAGPDTYQWPLRAGTVAEFCSLGGQIADAAWLDTMIENVPARVAEASASAADGFIVASDATSLGEFLSLYVRRDPALARRVIAIGSLFGLERSVAAKLGDRLRGMITSADVNPEAETYRAYAAQYAKSFPEQAPVAHSIEHYYDSRYRNAVEAVLEALDKVDGDLSGGQFRFRAALTRVELDAPQGHIRLDANRQAIGPVYLRQIVGNDRGVLTFRTIRTIRDVDASFGGRFGPGDPRPDRTLPHCVAGNPPAWATAG